MEPIDPADVRAALDRMLASQAFVNAGRLSRMLRFVVERTLDGQGGQLKEYLLGVEVFDRPSDYDPRMDSIVRVEARRLRAKLAEYYEAEGAGDPLRIRIAKGGYAPTFERIHEQAAVPASPGRRPRMFTSRIGPLILAVLLAAAAAYIWSTSARVRSPQPVVTVAVLPFHVFSGRADDRRLADRLADGVTTKLARVAALGVAAHTSARQYRDPQRSVGEIGQALGVKVVMEGTAHIDAQMVRLEIRLVDSTLGRKLWVEDFVGRREDLDGLEHQVAHGASKFLLDRYRPERPN
jgi:TolB-like protein